jgi:NADP-dependent aldehyde dehydrogenase
VTTSIAELDTLVEQAQAAAPAVARASDATRAGWLRSLASKLEEHSEELVRIATEETHLDVNRLTGEVNRTTGQLRLFADAIIEGSYLEATIDHANPATGTPDLRRVLLPIGPVAVFAGSNFPFAFSVAGGDTASALAVGCPVIVKAHSGHLRLSERTAEIVTLALQEEGAPAGTFALVSGRDVGSALVQHPGIRAASFTGSVGGGRALFDLAAARPDPIPFYGELGSINPTVLTRAAIEARGVELASGLAISFTQGIGQFCTKPGVVFIPDDSGFESLLVDAVSERPGGQLLTERIATAYPEGLRAVSADPDVTVVYGRVDQGGGDSDAEPVVLATSAEAVRTRPETLLAETFGPTTLLVRYSSAPALHAALSQTPGSLTATVHAEPSDDIEELVDLLSARAGRVLFKGWPTGVAVTWSQNHGGPWPSTTSIHTSVGVSAMRRFQRPIVFQDAPATVLPPSLLESNPLQIPRRLDGGLKLQG